MKNWLKSWRTTTLGVIGGLAVGLAPFAVPGATFTAGNVFFAVLIVLFGAVAQDFAHADSAAAPVKVTAPASAPEPSLDAPL